MKNITTFNILNTMKTPVRSLMYVCQYCGILSEEENTCGCSVGMKRQESESPVIPSTFAEAESDDASRMLPVTSGDHGGSRNFELWSHEDTLVLISTVKDNYKRLTGRAERRKAVWKNITSVISEKKPGITNKQVENKWKNLKSHFIKYEENKNKTGASRMREPIFYDLLASILLERPTINPTEVCCVGLGDLLSPIATQQELSTGTTSSQQPSTLKKTSHLGFSIPEVSESREVISTARSCKRDQVLLCTPTSRVGTPGPSTSNDFNIGIDFPLPSTSFTPVSRSVTPGLDEADNVDDPPPRQEDGKQVLYIPERGQQRKKRAQRRIRPITRTDLLSKYLQSLESEAKRQTEELIRHNKTVEEESIRHNKTVEEVLQKMLACKRKTSNIRRIERNVRRKGTQSWKKHCNIKNNYKIDKHILKLFEVIFSN